MCCARRGSDRAACAVHVLDLVGIERDVYLYARPTRFLDDMTIEAGYDHKSDTGILSISALVTDYGYVFFRS